MIKSGLCTFGKCIAVLMFFGSMNLHAQDSSSRNFWDVLAKVEYKVEEDEFGELYVPEFSSEIKNLEGKEITLQGFIIPFKGMVKPKHIILSSLPVDACFFCGTGGPETVAEVFLKEELKYTARPIRIKGTLKVNSKDVNELIYILENASFAGYAD